MTELEAIRARHSVRQYLNKPLKPDELTALRAEVDACNREHFSQMRVCHMWEGTGRIAFGVYACSPEDSSFTAVFDHIELTECKWLAHDGQAPDEE